MTRAALLVPAALLLSACGGRTSAPSPSNPADIGGTYAGPTADNSTSPPQQVSLWTIKFTRAGEGRTFFRGCIGTLVIQQTGSSFTGSFTQADSCAPTSGSVTSGIVRPDGAVTFSLAGTVADPLAWTGFTNCTNAIPGTMNFTGTVTGRLLDVSFAQNAVIDCPNEGTVALNVRLRGTR